MTDHSAIRNIRQSYDSGSLHEDDLSMDPVSELQAWMEQAVSEGVPEPQAMTLATVDADGNPSARIVLCRGISEQGLLFFTNYAGRKATELADDGRAAAVFFWQPQERQVRVEGRVQRASTAESDDYFASRPRESRLGAWASPQSQIIESREVLEQNLVAQRERFEGEERIPRPPEWGGLRLVPERIEFWQGRASRLHDRLVYSRSAETGAEWKRVRLAP